MNADRPNIFAMKFIIVCTAFRTVEVRIEGRKYDTRLISEASFKRLQTVLEGIPLEQRHVELDPGDLTPTAYFWYGKKHIKKAAQS